MAETKVRLVREAQEHLAKVRKSFVEKSAKIVNEGVSKKLTSEITPNLKMILILHVKMILFKIFQTFAGEYANSYLNEKSKTAKLLKVVDVKDKAVAEAKAEVQEVKKICPE